MCVCVEKEGNGYNNCLSASQKSFFERTLKLKENNVNFGTIIHIKSWAVRLAVERYNQLTTPENRTQKNPSYSEGFCMV